MSHERITSDSELSAIEAALGSLAPARSRIDRDLVMFRAGQSTARAPSSTRRAWVVSALSLGLIAMAEGLLLAYRPPPRVVEKVIVVREPAGPGAESPPERALVFVAPAPAPRLSGEPLALGRTAYERMAEQVLRYGLDGLPAPPATMWTSSEPRSAASRHSLQEEVRRVLDLGDHS